MNIEPRTDWTLKQGVPIGPQLYRILRERIVSADLPPGSRISESEVARTYSLSRQPVREAFIKLAEDGLVEVRPQRGTLVRKISPDAVMDARFVREAIEADIVKLVAENVDEGLVRTLQDQIARQRALPDSEAEAFLALDERFHRTLADAAGKSYAWKVIEDVKLQMDRVRYLSALHFSKRELVIQHSAIADAIIRRDPEGAAQAMRTHLRKILTDLPTIAATRPDFFETAERGR
ncbi:GntR family transcriptional regulator [Chelativorans sp. M5D2P16]|uniref:GntR family transcriptional regulator n=1 Tax=Chelativorans sp. M5D2P16 TaxID=3095678 RepID=UPI002ACA1682|nr:GntR family transcriptional regulator [Chelativorans sp. M5D2P16]MDZ5700006.1 GntR family transcriptional regulator [Chelativorans sp. M5D2P16]